MLDLVTTRAVSAWKKEYAFGKERRDFFLSLEKNTIRRFSALCLT